VVDATTLPWAGSQACIGCQLPSVLEVPEQTLKPILAAMMSGALWRAPCMKSKKGTSTSASISPEEAAQLEKDCLLDSDEPEPVAPQKERRTRRTQRLQPLPGPFTRAPIEWMQRAHEPRPSSPEDRLFYYLLHKSHWGQKEVRVTNELARKSTCLHAPSREVSLNWRAVVGFASCGARNRRTSTLSFRWFTTRDDEAARHI
jgi:hypothetical protein